MSTSSFALTPSRHKAAKTRPSSEDSQVVLDFRRTQKYPSHPSELNDAMGNLMIRYREIDDYKDFLVLEVLWAKNTQTVQHEFIVIKCQVPYEEDGATLTKHAYLKVERTATVKVNEIDGLDQKKMLPQEVLEHPSWRKEDWKAFQKQLRKEQKDRAGGIVGLSISQATSNGSQASVDQSRSSSPSLLQSKPALDCFLRLPDGISPFVNPPIPCEHLATLSFSGELPYLRDVLLAAAIISKAKPVYNMVMAQCYWFAQTFFNLLQAKFHLSCQMHHQDIFLSKAGKMRLINGWFPMLPPQTHDIANEIQLLYQELDDAIVREDELLDNSNRAGKIRAEAGRVRAEANTEEERAGRVRAEANTEEERAGRVRAEAVAKEEQERRERTEKQLAAALAEVARLTKNGQVSSA